MESLRRMKLASKLAIAFGAVLVLSVGASGIALNRIMAMSAQWQQFESLTLAKRVAVAGASDALAKAVYHFKNYVLHRGDNDKQFNSDVEDVANALAGYRNIGELSQQEEVLLRAAGNALEVYRQGMKNVAAAAAATASSQELDGQLDGADRPIAVILSELLELSDEGTRRASQHMDALLGEAKKLVISAVLVLVIAGVGFAVGITRGITVPLSKAVRVARRVAAGDLTSQIEVRTHDETGQLLEALQQMNANLKQIVGQVRVATEAISVASEQIVAGNADLSQRTDEQASSLEETASSMEELTSTVKENAEHARHANQLAAGASNVAVKGGEVVGQVVDTMSSINASSKKIEDIIGVIDGIAFQTNILALNAAVEAARAGEQGRGFAVVASEVRSLAQRSAAAAKEIKQLISDSVHKVENGTRLVDEAGKTMDEIVASVKRVTDIMGEITAASQEQSSGIEQVNQAIAQMDDATQRNAALVEEASATAETLQDQARKLTYAVAAFTLTREESAALQPAEDKRLASVTALPVRGKSDRAAVTAREARDRASGVAG